VGIALGVVLGSSLLVGAVVGASERSPHRLTSGPGTITALLTAVAAPTAGPAPSSSVVGSEAAGTGAAGAGVAGHGVARAQAAAGTGAAGTEAAGAQAAVGSGARIIDDVGIGEAECVRLGPNGAEPCPSFEP
jgi:hypothetical protein